MDKQEHEPADERDPQSGEGVRDMQFCEQPGQAVIEHNRGDDRDQIGERAVRGFDVCHGAGVVIQPRLAKERVPSQPDKEMYDHKNPDSEMVDFVVHEMF